MSAHLPKLHRASPTAPTIFAPVRALGVLERRRTRRQPHEARGTTTQPAAESSPSPADRKAVYWPGDERDTTQGDW